MKRILSIIFAVVFVFSCESDPDGSGDSIIKPDHGPPPIEDGVNLKIYGRPLVKYYEEANVLIAVRTKKIFGCINYYIEYTFEQERYNLTMDLTGVGIGDVCLTALGPATARKYLQLDSETYRFYIFNGSEVDIYKLSIKDDRIEIIPIRNTFSDPEYNVFWLSPENSFALCCAVYNDSDYNCEHFKTYLRSRIMIREFIFPEYGRIPYPPQGDYYKYYFAEWNEIETLFIEYCGSYLPPYNGNVRIDMVSWEGEILRSKDYD